MPAIDLTGKRFGRLITIRRSGSVSNGSGTLALWFCECDCGSTTEVRSSKLRSGRTRSCGCLQREMGAINGKAVTTHGHASPGNESRTYRSWKAMKERCTNPNHVQYHNYGGRGIEVCERWLHSFENFLEDMGERPEGKTLDRYPDPSGNYEPGNCRWATPKQQQANRRPSTEWHSCAI